MHQITIIVVGPAGSGRTRVAKFVGLCLRSIGFVVSIVDDENQPGLVESTLQAALKEISSGTTIHVQEAP